MNGDPAGSIRRDAVLAGWVTAVLVGFATSFALRELYGIFAGSPVERGGITAGLVVVSLASGFLCYLAGGFVAARLAGRDGGRNGAATAVLGLVVGVALAAGLALFGAVFTGGVAVPPAGFGLAGGAPAAGLVLFAANLFGGYVGGKLGEPSPPELARFKD